MNSVTVILDGRDAGSPQKSDSSGLRGEPGVEFFPVELTGFVHEKDASPPIPVTEILPLCKQSGAQGRSRDFHVLHK